MKEKKRPTSEPISESLDGEEEALPSYFESLNTSKSVPLRHKQDLCALITGEGPVKSHTEGYRAFLHIDKNTADKIKRRLPAISPSVQFKGLGKTIEAGLVVEELVLRHRARTAVIVCPPSLRVKWQDEMREKFGISFQIVDSQTTKETRRAYGLAVNPFRLYPFTIVSMDWLAQPRAQRLLSEVYAEADNSAGARHFAFDIIVVDEAHHVAPAAPTSVGGGCSRVRCGLEAHRCRARAGKALRAQAVPVGHAA